MVFNQDDQALCSLCNKHYASSQLKHLQADWPIFTAVILKHSPYLPKVIFAECLNQFILFIIRNVQIFDEIYLCLNPENILVKTQVWAVW